jgi:hypothetical protein
MSTATEKSAVLNEAVFNAWLEKGKLRRRATGRKASVAAAILVVLLAVGSMLYLFAGK